jgi:Transposase DDE domain group 1
MKNDMLYQSGDFILNIDSLRWHGARRVDFDRRLQLHALAYSLANFLRTLPLPAEVAQWSMTTLRERQVKIGARIIRHGQSIIFRMAEVMVLCALFQTILGTITALRRLPSVRC